MVQYRVLRGADGEWDEMKTRGGKEKLAGK